MDRIQSLEEANEQAYVENQNLKSEISKIKKELSQTSQQRGEIMSQQKRLEMLHKSDQEQCSDLSAQIKSLESRQARDKE